MKSILAVEDNEFNLEFLKITLELMGLDYDCARNGLDAISCLENKRYDLILMDCCMPELDGYEATKRIREKKIHTPIIALSASFSEEDKVRCISCGMNHFLQKPVEAEALFHIMDEFACDSLKEKKELVELIETLSKDMGFEREQSQYLIRGFLEEFMTIMKSIQDKRTTATVEEIKSYLHQLKGMARNMRASRVYDLTKKVEEALQGNNELDQFLSPLQDILIQYLMEYDTM